MSLMRIFYPLAHGLLAVVVTIGGNYQLGGMMFLVTLWCWAFYDLKARTSKTRSEAYRQGMGDAYRMVSRAIRPGPLPGSGFDDVAHRNGLIIAANLILSKMEDAK